MKCSKIISLLYLIILLLITVIPGNTLKGQDYIWPTDASRALTSTFAEYRPGRFHAGIDIKTWGKTGYKIFAIADGYISRLRVSPFGYGKSLYLTLDSGETVVYAHLDGFCKELEDYIWAEQEKRGRYSIQLFLSLNQFRYKQGDFLGYTGQTGVGFPHLHFELRDANERPINPFLRGYVVADNAAPVITKISITPLNASSTVNNDWKPVVLSVQNIGSGQYIIEQPLSLSGLVGFGLSAFDTMENITNKFGTYKNELYINDELVFSSTYDKFSYDDNNHAVLDREFRLAQNGRGNYYKLYLEDGNSLPFYAKKTSDYGTLYFQNQPDSILLNLSSGARVFTGKDHSFCILAQDYWGNTSQVSGKIQSVAPVYNESAKDQKPVQYDPWQDLWAVTDTTLFTITPEYYDNYVRFEFTPIISLPGQVSAFYHFAGTPGKKMPLIRKNGKLIGCVALDNYSYSPLLISVTSFIEEQTLRQTTPFFFQPVLKNQSKTVSSDDELCQLEFSANSLFKTIFVRITRLTNPGSDVWKFASNIYRVDPGDVPLNKGATIKIRYDSTVTNPRKLGIYYLNSSQKWVYFGKLLDEYSKTVGGYVGTFGTHALLIDDVPPEIISLSPQNNAHLQNAYPQLRAVFRDMLSGIQGEDNMQLLLDGVPVIAEYDPEHLSLTYKMRKALLKGQHTLELFLKDNCGNTSSQKNIFWVD